MNKGSSLNFLPEDQKKDAQEALKNKTGSQDREIKLVVPTASEKQSVSKEKLSFWERRKQKKQQKRREALRKKGETAIKEAKKTTKQVAEKPKEVRSKLFTEQLETRPSQPKPKANAMPKLDPVFKPAKKVAPKKDSSPTDLPKIKPMAEKQPKPKLKQIQKESEPALERTTLTFTEQPRAKMHQPESGKSTDFGGPNVNLVPESVRSAEAGQPWILAAISLLIIVAIWFVAAGITVTHVQNVKAQVTTKKEEAAKIKALILELEEAKQASQKLQKQFGAVQGLLNAHVYWSPFFENLEQTTIPDVYYVRITVTQTGEVVLRAIAKSYAAAARQIRAFEKAPSFVDSVTVKEAVVELQPGSILPVDIVAFDISLDLEDSLLQKQEVIEE